MQLFKMQAIPVSSYYYIKYYFLKIYFHDDKQVFFCLFGECYNMIFMYASKEGLTHSMLLFLPLL